MPHVKPLVSLQVWMTAAVGNAVGGGLYVPAVFTVAASIVLLNFVPDRVTGVSAAGPMAKPSTAWSAARMAACGAGAGGPAATAGGGGGHPFPYGRQASHTSGLAPSQRDNVVNHLLLNATAVLTAVYAALAIAAPWTTPPCERPDPHRTYGNADYAATLDPCRYDRYAVLGGLSKWDADMCVRLTVAVLLGALVGWERRRGDRGYVCPAIERAQTPRVACDAWAAAWALASGRV